MRDYIEIKKELIPYSFEIFLLGEKYKMVVNYNKTEDLFTVTLSKNEEILVFNEPLVYGVPLFADIYKTDVFPKMILVPFDESGISKDVTYENFGETVFLTVGENV